MLPSVLCALLATVGQSFLIHDSCNNFNPANIEAAMIEAIDMADNAAKRVVVTQGRGNLFQTIVYGHQPVNDNLDEETRGVVRGKF